jgi:hypothetical protein
MTSVLKPVLAAAGATYASRKSNKYASQAFHQRIQDAEKHGIHPLQAIGGAGNFQGTGGFNVGNMINNERASRKLERRADKIAEREQQYQLEQLEQKGLIQDQVNHQQHIRKLHEQSLAPDTFGAQAQRFGEYTEVPATLKHWKDTIGDSFNTFKDAVQGLFIDEGGHTEEKTLTNRGWR